MDPPTIKTIHLWKGTIREKYPSIETFVMGSISKYITAIISDSYNENKRNTSFLQDSFWFFPLGYYLNSKGKCILPHQCDCKDEEGLLRRPNEQWRPDNCSVCICRNGRVKCQKECKVTTCPEVRLYVCYKS